MKHIQVRSSNIDTIGYDDEQQKMHIRFKGSGQTYEYDVPPEVHSKLLAATSVGQHFSKYIRPAYEGRKVS